MSNRNTNQESEPKFMELVQSGAADFPSTAPETLSQTMVLAGVMSGLFPQNKYAIASRIVIGKDIGLPLTLSVNAVHIVEGKLVLGVHAISYLIKSSCRYRWKVVKEDGEETVLEWFERIDGQWESVGQSSYSKTDAQLAGWLNKDNWRKHPKDMLYKQALTIGGRRYAPDVMHGVYSEDELTPAVEPARSRQRQAQSDDVVETDAVLTAPSPEEVARATTARAQEAAASVGAVNASRRRKASAEAEAEVVHKVEPNGEVVPPEPEIVVEPEAVGPVAEEPAEPEAEAVAVSEPEEDVWGDDEDEVEATAEAEPDDLPDAPEVDEDGAVVESKRDRPSNYTEELRQAIGMTRFSKVLEALGSIGKTVADLGARCDWSLEMEDIAATVTELKHEHEKSTGR